MSIQAYQKMAAKTANPRDTEYRLLTDVTRALIQAKLKGRADLSGLTKALDWNRRVWSALAMDCAHPDNGLPENLRAGIISLSIFVGRYTSAVIREGEDIDELIELNKTVMQGLTGRTGENQPETGKSEDSVGSMNL